MSEAFANFLSYFQYSFVIYALITGVLISLCSSLLGVTLVLKRFSYIGDGLSHAAFGALSIATVLKLTNTMYFVLPITIIAAIVILCAKDSAKVKGDASVAMISTGALAFGYIIVNIFGASANISGDVCSTLFGSTSILTLTIGEVVLSVVLCVIVVSLYVFFYNRIFAMTFDSDFARASGMKTNLYNIAMASVIAITIVLAMNLVGTLLISALIIFPAVSAMAIFKNFKSVTIASCAISVFCAFTGIVASIAFSTPVGSTIVVADVLVFAFCSLSRRIFHA
jgi:zinc transport system permease protein